MSGLNFMPFVGIHPLPNNEGKYQVVSRAGKYYVSMNTYGNSQVYRHPLSKYSGADRTINCGTIQFFSDLCTTK